MGILKKIIVLLALASLAVCSFLIAYGFKAGDVVNFKMVAYAFVGLVVSALIFGIFKSTAYEIFPLSEEQKRQMREAEEKRKVRKQVRQAKYEATREELRLKNEDRKAKLQEKKAARKRAVVDKFLEKELQKGSFDPETAAEIKSGVHAKLETMIEYGPGKQSYHEGQTVIEIDVLNAGQASDIGWVGGNPSMPSDIPWPEVDGNPCNFYYQINCSILPAGLWGGMGPRDGWLLFFADREHFGNVRIIYSKELGQEVAAPTRPNHYYGPFSKVERYFTIASDVEGLPPRWPIKLTDKQLRPETHYSKISNLRAQFRGGSLVDNRLMPADNLTFQELINEFDTYLSYLINESGERHSSIFEPGTPGFETRFKTLQEYRHFVSTLDANLSPPNYKRFIDGIMSISTEAWYGEKAQTKFDFLGQHETPKNNFFQFLELYLRMNYAALPSTLPNYCRAEYIDYWQELSWMEPIVMGGVSEGGYPYSDMENPVFLLELRTSNLLDWQFGDSTRFGIFISPKDMKDANWAGAWGDILN